MLRRIGWTALLCSATVALAVGCNSNQDDPGPSVAADSSALCPDHLASGADLGIQPVPLQLQDSYGKIFCKYTEIIAPNGDPIRLFAQREISNDQML
jgi:hypothetical protein